MKQVTGNGSVRGVNQEKETRRMFPLWHCDCGWWNWQHFEQCTACAVLREWASSQPGLSQTGKRGPWNFCQTFTDPKA